MGLSCIQPFLCFFSPLAHSAFPCAWKTCSKIAFNERLLVTNSSGNISHFSITIWGNFFWLYNSRLRLHSLHFSLLLRSYFIRLFSLAALKTLSLSLVCFTITWYMQEWIFLCNLTWDLWDFLTLWISVFHHFCKIFSIIPTNTASDSVSPFSVLCLIFLTISCFITCLSYFSYFLTWVYLWVD